jgi:hypothetical protein
MTAMLDDDEEESDIITPMLHTLQFNCDTTLLLTGEITN